MRLTVSKSTWPLVPVGTTVLIDSFHDTDKTSHLRFIPLDKKGEPTYDIFCLYNVTIRLQAVGQQFVCIQGQWNEVKPKARSTTVALELQ